MGAHAGTLPAFEIPVGGRDDALTGLDLLAATARAHGASRLAPQETGLHEEIAQAPFLRLAGHRARARHDHGPDPIGDLAADNNARRAFEIGEARVGAGA